MSCETRFIVVDTSDAYHTSVRYYNSEKTLLEGVQNKDLEYIEVYEINRKVKLKLQPSIVLDD